MIRRRLVPLVVVVTALLAVVAIAARGRPLSSGGGRSAGLPVAFWDYAFTTLLILLVASTLGALVMYAMFRREPSELKPYPARAVRALAILLVVAVAVVLIGRHINLNRLLHPNGSTTTSAVTTPPGPQANPGKPGTHTVQFQWTELAAVLGVLLVVGVAAAATRSRRGLRLPARSGRAPEMLAAALDESLDDLRAEPDLRRAIVAAYARMETTLAAAGLPRDPAEAPLEYLERTLLSLDTSADAVRRLTDLFEWARFSHHEPEPQMRDEAVDALVAVRDELRAGEAVAT